MDRRELELAIAAQERLRGAVPDAIVDATVAVLRGRLVALESGASQRRRQMTVLFADLIGFTEMSESMDAEDVTAVMNAVWTRLDEVVVRHGGLIDKHIGDALMAIWGRGRPKKTIRSKPCVLRSVCTRRSTMWPSRRVWR